MITTRDLGSHPTNRVRSRVPSVLQSLALALALSSHAYAGPSTSIPPANQPLSGPETALDRWAQAYRSKSPEGVGSALSADYVFHTQADSLRGFLNGVDRASEMRSTRGLLEGVTKDGVVLMPPADSVKLVIDGVRQGLDPEHPDSTQHYRTLTTTRFELRVVMGNGNVFTVPNSRHVMHVVRGDAAVLAEGQTADPERWYIRRWLNDVSAVAATLREGKGGCGEEDAPSEPGTASAPGVPGSRPAVLAIRPLVNPACAKLEVTCDLPRTEAAWIEVYDVAGRRVNRRDVPAAAAGRVTIEAGAGAKLSPGIYWVRLGQNGSRPDTRMVAVAK